MNKREKALAWIQLISLLLAAMVAGILMGIAYEQWQLTKTREPIEIGDFSDEISLLHFDTIENGILKGRLEGEGARVVVRDAAEVYSIFPGEFSVPVTEILPLLKTIPSPEGMAFVASKNGKYFYPLDSVGAASISVRNRIFFSNQESAKKAGFVQKKK